MKIKVQKSLTIRNLSMKDAQLISNALLYYAKAERITGLDGLTHGRKAGDIDRCMVIRGFIDTAEESMRYG